MARTTKKVLGLFMATFHGDYIDPEAIENYLNEWMSGGLEDRDDLRSWSLEINRIELVSGDPEGYDS